VSLAYGVGVPGFEAALAILHALLSHEEKSVIDKPAPVTQNVINDTKIVTVDTDVNDKKVSLTVTERRSRLSQLLTSVSATTDNIEKWAKEFGTSDRTIRRDIAQMQGAGD
jgi:hypothetical protein